jgi:hypothetical protein
MTDFLTPPASFVETLDKTMRIAAQSIGMPQVTSVPYRKWESQANGWRSAASFRNHPMIFSSGHLSRDLLDACGAEIRKYAPGLFRGIHSIGSIAPIEESRVIDNLLGVCWRRWGTLLCNEAQRLEVISELFHFLQTKEVKYLLVAPVLNLELSGSSKEVVFDDALRIRRLSDEEATEIIETSQTEMYPSSKFAITSDFTVRCGFGEAVNCNEMSAAIEIMRQVELSLRLVKGGKVGVQGIHFFQKGFGLIGGKVACGFPEYFIPRDIYEVDDDFAQKLVLAWKQIKCGIHDDLKSAIERLNLAEVRVDSKDRVLDGVIGLESLLLRDGGDETYRGELRFRFALHYSVLTGIKSKRLERFKLARSLYDFRSSIAHGGTGAKKTGNAALDMPSLSCEMLREVIYFFLSEGWPPTQDYWLTKIFD